MRPAPPEWLTQRSLNRDNVDSVHVGRCWAAKDRGRCRRGTREQALNALRSQAPPCVHCRTDRAFGRGTDMQSPGRRTGRG
ncbi:DUF6233 domain-containing protein [Streptomyces olivaceoviridis]|uniref:DUF6233 domain-containing protein n=1 Tax=Streptomyces olivaceoviridis TaxID=1921 RepID=UPI0036FCB23F